MFFVVLWLCPNSFASSKGMAPSLIPSSPFIFELIIVRNFSDFYCLCIDRVTVLNHCGFYLQFLL